MSENIYVYCDLETGDLRPIRDDISGGGDILTGYFGFFDKDLKMLDELSLKLKPDDRLPQAQAGALKVNKINLQEHMTSPDTITYSEARELLIAMLKKHLKKNGRFSNLIFSGFNCGFDSVFVKEYLLPNDEFEQFFHYKFRDVMGDIECLKFYGWLPSDCGKLTQCADYFGVAQGTAHTAKDDILMTIEVQKKIKILMDSKKNGGQVTDLISLLEAE